MARDIFDDDDDILVADEEAAPTPEELAQLLADEEEILRTHDEVDPLLVGIIDSLGNGQCKTIFKTNAHMIADKEKLIHNGFIGAAGEYAAIAAINDPMGIVYSQQATYYAPVRVGDEIQFQATARHMDGRKREVDVVGNVGDIKVYEARFTVLVHEYHPLKIKLMDVAGLKN